MTPVLHVWYALIAVTLLYINNQRYAHEPPVISVRIHMCIISQHGLSALMYAARKGQTEVITQLLEAGANIDLKSTKV